MKILFCLIALVTLVFGEAKVDFGKSDKRSPVSGGTFDPSAKGEVKMDWKRLKGSVEAGGEVGKDFLKEYGSSEGTWLKVELALVDFDVKDGTARVRGSKVRVECDEAFFLKGKRRAYLVWVMKGEGGEAVGCRWTGDGECWRRASGYSAAADRRLRGVGGGPGLGAWRFLFAGESPGLRFA